MATYNRAAIPSTGNAAVPNRVESLVVFFCSLFWRIAGTRTVIEVEGGQPIPAADYSFFRAQDNKVYMSWRVRIPVSEEHQSNGLPIWASATDEVTGSLPTVYGGV